MSGKHEKQDPRPHAVLRLECGHETIGAITAQRKKCKHSDCRGRMMAVVGIDGRVPAPVYQTPLGQRRRQYDRHDDGLVVVHYEDTEAKHWWCSWCDGERLETINRKAHLRFARGGLDDVEDGWSKHRDTGYHSEIIRRLDKLDSVVTTINPKESTP